MFKTATITSYDLVMFGAIVAFFNAAIFEFLLAASIKEVNREITKELLKEFKGEMEKIREGGFMYSPKIDEKHIPTLYKLANEKRIPMTRLVNEIIGRALKDVEAAGIAEESNNLENK